MSFPAPKEFSGGKEQFDEVCYKLRACMSLHNPGYATIFKEIDDNPRALIKDENLHEVQQLRAEHGQMTYVVIADTQLAHYASLL